MRLDVSNIKTVRVLGAALLHYFTISGDTCTGLKGSCVLHVPGLAI